MSISSTRYRQFEADLSSGLRSRPSLVVLLTLVAIAVAAVAAWHSRFLQDDSYITFIYARNLAEGHGLVWTTGERVMGYTNFLWVLVLAAGIKLGIMPEQFSLYAGMLIFVATMGLSFRLAQTVLESPAAALLPTFLLAVNHTFTAYATGGMETQLQTSLILLATLLAAEAFRRRAVGWGTVAAFPIASALALLTRYDSALLLAPCGLLLLLIILQQDTRPAGKAAMIVSAALLGAAVLAPCLIWMHAYYGNILPNTFYAKTGAHASIIIYARGLIYVGLFFALYLLVALIPVVALRFSRLLRQSNPLIAVLVAQVALQVAYITWVGGDFMEFRFLVPVIPAVYVLAGWCVLRSGLGALAMGGLAALLAIGTLVNLAAGGFVLPKVQIGTTKMLNDFVGDTEPNWATVGRALAELAGSRPPVVLALAPVGAIPYYSGLPTIDMLGLNDRWVARNGLPLSSVPGHRIIAPESYLVRRGANLVLGHPWIAERSALDDPEANTDYFFKQTPKPGALPPNGCIVFIPVMGQQGLLAYYLTKHPAIDERIASGRWLARCPAS